MKIGRIERAKEKREDQIVRQEIFVMAMGNDGDMELRDGILVVLRVK